MNDAEAGPSLASWQLNGPGFDIVVTGPAAALAGLAARFPAVPRWAVSTVQAGCTTLEVEQEPAGGAFRILRDGLPVAGADDAEALPGQLDRAISRVAVEGLGRRNLVFRAGAVARAGRGLLMAAPPASGLTTLLAALVASGFRYVGDEVAVVDATERLLPFPRSLRLGAAWSSALRLTLPGLPPPASYACLEGGPAFFHVPEAGQWADTAAPIGFVVFPRYIPGARTALVQIDRSEALERLLLQTLNLPPRGADDIARIVGLLRHAACYRLNVGNLREAVATLAAAVASG